MLCCVDVGDDEDISWKYGWRWLVTTYNVDKYVFLLFLLVVTALVVLILFFLVMEEIDFREVGGDRYCCCW